VHTVRNEAGHSPAPTNFLSECTGRNVLELEMRTSRISRRYVRTELLQNLVTTLLGVPGPRYEVHFTANGVLHGVFLKKK
jgi:hypothetical protein